MTLVEFATSFGKAGGVEQLVAVIKRYSRSSGCMKAACWAVYNVCLHNPESIVAFVHCRGLTCLLEVLESHSASESVTKASCRALQAIVTDAEGKDHGSPSTPERTNVLNKESA